MDGWSERECGYVLQLNSSEERCDFVRECRDCLDGAGRLADYTQLYFCTFRGEALPALSVLLSWLGLLFVGLAAAAEDFFSPNLATISNHLGLSHNVAGVTLLALGNGAPDLFSALAGSSQGRPQLVLGQLTGAAVLLTSGVAGAVCLAAPFHLMVRPFLRDVAFLAAAGFWAFWAYYRGEIRPTDSLGFLLLYLLYISVVIVGRWVNQRARRRRQRQQDQLAMLNNDDDAGSDDNDEGLSIFVPPPRISPARPRTDEDEENAANEETEEEEDVAASANRDADVGEDLDTVGFRSLEPAPQSPFARQWGRMWGRVWPGLCSEEAPALCSRDWLWLALKGPATACLSLTVPVVDPEEEELRGWSRFLTVAQCYLTPIFVLAALGVAGAEVAEGVRAWQLAIFVGQAAAVAVLCSTTDDLRPPFWQPLLSYLGFASAVCWIYLAAGEVVSTLKALGAAWGASDAILGLTLLAWGNSVGDLAADVAVARRGLPRMGFSACLGGPLMNLLLGMGGPFALVMYKRGWRPMKVALTPVGAALAGSLALTLITHMVVFPVSRFNAGRIQGVVLLCVYFLSMTAVLLAEFGLLPFLPGARMS